MSDADPPSQNDRARAILVEALAAVARGEQAALRRVYDLTSAKLLGICLRISGDRSSAEDILQGVYVKVWERAGRFDATRASPITWLCTIARNSAIDWRRSPAGRNAPGPTVGEGAAYEIADEGPRADQMLLDAQDGARLHFCLGELDDRARRCINAAFFDGLTYVELAKREAVPLGTMKSWIRRGLMRLKSCVDDG